MYPAEGKAWQWVQRGARLYPRRGNSQRRHGEGQQASPWLHAPALRPHLFFLLSSFLASTPLFNNSAH